MNRYVLKINDSTYVSDIDWIAMVIPTITTDSFDNAMIVDNSYLDYIVIKDGQTRKDLILQKYPHIKILKVKIVIDD